MKSQRLIDLVAAWDILAKAREGAVFAPTSVYRFVCHAQDHINDQIDAELREAA